VTDMFAFCTEQEPGHIMPSTLLKLFWIDSITRSARIWSHLLRRLTCHNEVAYLTMAYWQPILNPYRLLRERQAWCPLCYEDWLKAGNSVYEPLLWRLQRVDTCLVHQCKLVECCPGCGKQFTTFTSNGAVGFCPKCRTWLGNEAHAGQAVAIASESYRLSHAVGQLLTLAPQVTDLNKSMVPDVIETIHKRRVPYTNIKSALHISMTALSNIKAGARLPNLNTLAHLAILSEGALWGTLNGQATCLPESASSKPLRLKTAPQKQTYLKQLLASSDPLPALSYVARTCGFSWVMTLQKAFPVEYEILRIRIYEEQRQALQDILDGDVIMTVIELARRRDYHQSILVHRFPELCRQVTQAHHKRKLSHCRQYLLDLIQTNCFPCITAITKTLEVGSYYLTQHFPEEMRLIEAQHHHQIQQQEQVTRQYLDAALASDLLPPMSLQEIARELDTSVKTLKRNFPIHSREILDRRREYMVSQIQLTCQQIRQTVFELHQQGIYPSVDRLHAVIGIWMVHGKAHRNAYIEAMNTCGYLDVRTKSSMRHYIPT